MAGDDNFKESYNMWWFLGSVAVLIAFPLLHVICGWFTFWL